MTTRDQIMREANFWASRAILTGAELDVFTLLEAEPLAAGEMARRMGADPRAVDRLLDALAALGFLEKKEALFSLSEKGKLLSSHHGETMRPLLLHFANLWQDWGKLAAVVKEGRPARRTGMKMDGASRKAFIGAMDAAGRDLSERIAGSFDGSRFRRLLDIGGASGTYTAAFLRKNPQMTAVLFDLPPVAAIARGRLRDEGMLDRVSLAAGDYKKDPFPAGCDLALLSAVIHQNSRGENLALFAKIYRALVPGGVLLIRDFVMDPSRTKPAGGALFALNMLINTAGGDTYTFDEIRESLGKAGFGSIEMVQQGGQQDDLVKAEKTA